MTQQENRDFTSGEAFYEARQNIKAAEQFVDANSLDKAYAAACIAQAWTGLANGLHIRESTERWDGMQSQFLSPGEGPDETTSIADVLAAAPTASTQIECEHWHRASCWHEFVGPQAPATGPSQCKKCTAPFGPQAANQLCPNGSCPDAKPAEQATHTHGDECAHDWAQDRITDLPACENGCKINYSPVTKDLPCPAMCLGAS